MGNAFISCIPGKLKLGLAPISEHHRTLLEFALPQVPTIVAQQAGDSERIRTAIVGGSLLPLAM